MPCFLDGINVCFSVERCICEFRVLQLLGLAEEVAVCAERADTHLRISYFGGVDQDLLKVSD